ncbi:2018_t:CDS:2 [Dentiscutata heterogama]|uniref:2018_t:CDS:1 n=1 Tax=Dentiscutata heterogama TaxID=1316150 RepID=A0ACA9K114_9GLOM|nr:2018_t:CDS:2 [Dentiscutata heterogama]
MSEERIILNVGGIKYETFRSTLTAQPETLLGKMFQYQNEFIKNSANGNEYFFDRIAINTIDRFISSLEQLVISHYINFDNKISLSVGQNNNNLFDSRLSQFKGCDFDILNNMERQVKKHLVETFSKLDLKWKCQKKQHYYSKSLFFEIDITFSSPVETLLNSEDTQTHIAFTQAPINTPEEKVILNVGGKKYETFQLKLVAQPETLLGTMFQDRNKCMRHPINGNEYFFDRNSEAFHYIMEFYRTGKLTWPIEYGKVTCKQLEEELDYFQIPFDKSTVLCSSALEIVRNKFNNLILSFEELIIHCCNYVRNNIELEITRGDIQIIDMSDNRYNYYYLENLQMVFSSKFTCPETYIILDNIHMERHVGVHLIKLFSDLELKWKFIREYSCHKLFISFSFENVYNHFKKY